MEGNVSVRFFTSCGESEVKVVLKSEKQGVLENCMKETNRNQSSGNGKGREIFRFGYIIL